MVGKKAESISINVIIIAIIALLVLVVLMAIFGGQMGLWSKGLGDTQKQECMGTEKNQNGGKIVSYDTDCPDDYPRLLVGTFTDIKAGQKCCAPSLS